MADKIDFKKQLKHLYSPTAKAPVIVDVPPMQFMMIDGRGDPNTSEAYRDAVTALYSVSYPIKFMVKKRQGVDYGVMPLEGWWWVDDVTQVDYNDKSDWQWTMMIMQPDYVTADLFAEAVKEAGKKKPSPALERLRLEQFEEGQSAQIMHIGPYAAELPTIDRLHHFIWDGGYTIAGKHHEIYLNDPNKTAPDRLKTVIRYPVRTKEKED